MQTSYVTVYQEGYQSSTYSKEIPNPYSLCNNPPKKCHTSTNAAGNSLLPTTLSRWRVTFKVQSGEREVEWLAPNSTTDLYFIAKVTLRMLPHKLSTNRRWEIMRRAEQCQPDVCCLGDKYRSSPINSECKNCPSGSTSKLGDYYCEADPSNLRKKQHVYVLDGSPIKRRHSAKNKLFYKKIEYSAAN